MIDPALVGILADGNFHSGQHLGEVLRVSRGAIWNRMQALRDAGIQVHSVRGRGYCIPEGLDLLSVNGIKSAIVDHAAGLLDGVHVESTIGSTNDYALQRLRAGDKARIAVFAEQQTAGRGRRGRAWASPYAANIYCSLPWEFSGGFAALDGLSLAVGVAVCEAVAEAGVPDVGLKWPNDIVCGRQKLGGVLIEVSGEASGQCVAVIGVGVNVAMSRYDNLSIDQPWTDLRSAGVTALDRNAFAGLLLGHLVLALSEFSGHGLSAFVTRWRNRDVICGKSVDVIAGETRVSGTARGIDDRGGFLLEHAGEIRVFYGGEVSVREAR